jgi:hypothetical protein
MRRIVIPVTTLADGTATKLSVNFSGKIHSIHYLKDGTNPFADTVDIAITSDKTGENIWTEANVTASATRYPRAPTHSPAGAAALYAAGGVGVLDKIAVANDQLKIVIAQGGNAKTGAFHVLVD